MERPEDTCVEPEELPNLLDFQGHLSTHNFDAFDWSKARHLIITNCEKEIQLVKLQNCPELYISYIEFFGLTSYTNIKLLLTKCTNLNCISFVSVILNNYATDYRKFFIIHVPMLKELRFCGPGKITADELHILDFFYRRVRTSIKSIKFESIGELRKGKKSRITLTNKVMKHSLSQSALSSFILQNRGTINTIEINRPGISLPSIIKDEDGIEDENSKLRVDILACDPCGSIAFLSYQDRLVHLTCTKNKKNNNWTIEALEAVSAVIRRCAVTLKQIQITQTIHINFSCEEKTDKILFQHDCGIYKYCQNLERLHINVTQPSETYVTESKGSKVGVISNPRFIPDSLTHMIVKFDFVSPHGMELFVTKLTTMVHLRLVIIQGNDAEPFRFKSSWIVALIELPDIEIFEISGCQVEDVANIIGTLKESRPYVDNWLKVSQNRCVFWKPCHYDKPQKIYVMANNARNNNN